MADIEVEIYGGRYVIKGSEDAEYVRMLARYVDEKMRAAARKSPPGTGTHRIAVLTAMNVADELHRLKRRQEDVERMVHDKTGDLFEILKPDAEQGPQS